MSNSLVQRKSPVSPLAPEAPADALQSLYAPIASELAEVEAVLRSEMRSDYPYVDELVRYGCLLDRKSVV